MRLSLSRQLLLCLALLGAYGHAAAIESRQLDADGSNATADTANASATRAGDDATVEDATPTAPVNRPHKAKPASTPRGGTGNRSTSPRWHSFLPGMFR